MVELWENSLKVERTQTQENKLKLAQWILFNGWSGSTSDANYITSEWLEDGDRERQDGGGGGGAFSQRKIIYFIVILKSIGIDWKVGKGECVHDPSAARGRLSERQGGRQKGRKEKRRRVARGRSCLLVNKEGTEEKKGAKAQENEKERERKAQRQKEKEWGSCCPVESIQRGGAQYNSLGGEEIQWCKSNTLSRTHTHVCTHKYINTHTHLPPLLFARAFSWHFLLYPSTI